MFKKLITYLYYKFACNKDMRSFKRGHCVGNTTRQADACIQQLFESSDVFVQDHYCTYRATDRLVKIILTRLSVEHSISRRFIDRSNLRGGVLLKFKSIYFNNH